jgi:glycolate oxidase iron-sulfur subunit
MATVNHASATGTTALPGSPLEQARAGLDSCVHCGFCLQSCPTYLVLEDENDSPRGRLLLMRSLLDGSLPAHDPAGRDHLDKCLGCRACETACPSGVPYGHLLEATRATLTAIKPLPMMGRLLLTVFARPWLMRLAMLGGRVVRALRLSAVLARVMPGRFGFAMHMLDASRPSSVVRNPYARSASDSRGTAAPLKGCVMDGLFSHTNAATERVLAVNGYKCVEAKGQACCGALHAHAGDLAAARRMAKRNIVAFEKSGADFVVSNAAGCGAMLKEYGQLLAGEGDWADRAARVAHRARDVTELLAEAGPVPGGRLDATVTYDAPCHLVHAQRVTAPPLKVLAAIPGLTLVPLVDSEFCCGAAGIYNLLEPETSAAVLEPKIANVVNTGAQYVATGNPGCHMQIGAGLRVEGSAARVVHPVELLDASYANLPR